MNKDSNWKCLGEKSSGIICTLKDKCVRNKYIESNNNLFIAADFNSSNSYCENFLEWKQEEPTIEDVNNKKKKDSK